MDQSIEKYIGTGAQKDFLEILAKVGNPQLDMK